MIISTYFNVFEYHNWYINRVLNNNIINGFYTLQQILILLLLFD